MSVIPEVPFIVGVIRDLLAQALGVRGDEVDARKTFFELGLTSRIGVIWMGRVNNAFGLSMPAVRAYNYPTLEKLAGRIREELAASASSSAQPRTAPTRFGKRKAGTGGAVSASAQASPPAWPPASTSASSEPAGAPRAVRDEVAAAHGTPGGTAPRQRRIAFAKTAPAAATDASRNTRPAPGAHANAAGASEAAGAHARVSSPSATSSAAHRPAREHTAVAIVGMSGRFPGARDKSAFWAAIVSGRDCVTRVTRPYWNIDAVYSETPKANRTYSNWLGALDDIDRFDPLFFSISPADANQMDPQQRLFLQEAWSCLEDAGIRADTLAGSRCGVFVGHGTYGQSQNGLDLSAAGFLGASPSILAARIAYLLDLRGPCVTVDTACSASLVAIAQACDSLVLGTSDLALAGGVSILVDPSIHIMASQAGMLSPDGRCFSFDQRANGFVPGEGVGVVALKRLDDALRDGDTIYGRIVGWGVNQDGKTNGITAPSQSAQSELQRDVFQRFGIDPRSIGLMEAHGSGTKLGDPIEVEALVDAFRPYTDDSAFCALGSVKSNVGHLLAAAGIAGFFKAALALRHRTLPPSIHFSTLNEHISLAGTPFFVNTAAQPWQAKAGGARRAGVSSFGFSGTNAYMVLEEHEQAPRENAAMPSRELIVLSAHDDERLRAYARCLADALRAPGEGAAPRLDDIAHTLRVGRVVMDVRLAIVATCVDELTERLDAFADGRGHDAVFDRRAVDQPAGVAGVEEDDSGDVVDVARWFSQGRLESIGRAWVRRGFDWRDGGNAGDALGPSRDTGDTGARRIPLPTYPFAARRCEMPAFSLAGRNGDGANATATAARAVVPVAAISPLVQANVSMLDQIAFRSTFDGSEFFFTDHLVAGRKTLPGVAYLDIACAVGCAATGERVSGLRHVVWMRPFRIETVPATLVIRVKRQGGRTTFEIAERTMQEDVPCAQGEFIFGNRGEPPRIAQAERFADEAPLSGHDEIYARFAAQGFGYGPAFRAIRTLSRSGAAIVARIELPDGLARPMESGGMHARHYALLDGFVLHPGLLDSAFQPCHRAVEAYDPTRTYIPYALGAITVYDGLPARFHSIATLQRIDDELALFSIDLVDESGALRVRIDELALRPIPESRDTGNTRAAAAGDAIHFYRMGWTDAAREADATARRTTDATTRLVFVPGGFDTSTLAREHDVIVQPGHAFRQIGERRYEIDPASADDHALLWQRIARAAQPLAVVHAWALDEPPAADDSSADTACERLARNLLSPIFVARQLARDRAVERSALLYLHCCAGGGAEPEHLAASGLLRSLAAEQPGLLTRSIGIDASPADSELAPRAATLVRRELAIAHRAGDATEIRYLGERRVAAQARRMALGAAHVTASALREGGVYLISGGAGGLGLTLAEALVRRHGARVVLAGRTALEGLASLARERIRALGDAHALYVAADVTEAGSVAALVGKARARFGRLHGVFHCAGTMANAAVVNKTREAIERIVEPKVLGALTLDHATREEALDLFVVYSSVAATMRFTGQTDYAYANRFLDGFAARRRALAREGRRHGRTLSLGWSLWRDGGMTLDDTVVQLIERAHALVPLEATSGLDALEAVLAFGADATLPEHVVVVRGEAAAIEAAWPEANGYRAARVRDGERDHAAPTGTSVPLAATPHRDAGTLTKRVREELAALLKLDAGDIDPDRNLMRYGLDSINSMTLINRINERFGISVQPTELLQHPTLREFVAHLESGHLGGHADSGAAHEPTGLAAPTIAQPQEAPRPEKVESAYPDPYLVPFARDVAVPVDVAVAVAPLDPPHTAGGSTHWPMTYGQRAMWFLHQLNGGSAAYHIALTLRVRSALDTAAFERAYASLLRRHPALRARFREGGGEVEQVVDGAIEPDFLVIGCEGQPVDTVLAAMREAHRHPFDLEADALSRMRLYRRDGDDVFVLWTVHHLVSDAWSQWVMLEELLATYAAERNGGTLAFDAPARTFADFAADEARYLNSDEARRDLAFWQRQLDGAIPVLSLPADHPRPRVQTFNGASIPLVCDASVSDALRGCAREHGATPFTVLLAAYQCLLARLSGETRIWVGAPVSGRIDARDAGLVGAFINSVVLTADLGTDPAFGAFVEQQQRTVVAALAHQRLPFARLVELLKPRREDGRAPLFQAEFVYQKAHRTGDLIRVLSPEAGVAIDHAGLRMESVPFAQQEGQTDICLEMTEIDGRFVGSLKFNADLFDPATMRHLRDAFAALLARAVAQPDTRVSALPVAASVVPGHAGVDTLVALSHIEGPRRPQAGSTLIELFERQAAQTPDATALVDAHTRWSYRDLNARANRIAQQLLASGLRLGERVALCSHRCADMVAALLAIMKAGAAYVPMDPLFPVERLQLMLDDAQPAIVLTDRAATLPAGLAIGAAQLVDLEAQALEIARRESVDPRIATALDAIAYVMYTSGSTGRPKGVRIPHSALSNFLLSMRDQPGLAARDRLLAVTTISFDIAGLELYLPLIAGASVVLASRDAAMDPFALQRLLAEHRITVMQATPTTWRMLVEDGWRGGPELTILCGGEPLPRALARRLLQGGARVWNLYGPTETTIWSCVAAVEPDGDHAVEPIGEPIRNTSIHILDDASRPVPVGTIGELCIGGDGVAAGYLNRPELNAEKFVGTRWGRLYRTGDLARLTADGRLQFHGRADHQLKIRGFRVEAGEIEHRLREDARIADCVVTIWHRESDAGVDSVLTAYLRMTEGMPLTDAVRTQLREHIGAALPAYMVPSVFVALDVFPLTPNNKIDRKALPRPDTVGGGCVATSVELDVPCAAPTAALLAAAQPATAAQASAETPVGNGEAAPHVAPPRAVALDAARIAHAWRSVLQLPSAPAESHFFDAGGTSFVASRLMTVLRRESGLVVPVSLLFEHPTLQAFTQRVLALAGAAPVLSAGPASASAPAPALATADWAATHHGASDSASGLSDSLLDILERVRHGGLSVDQASRLIDEIQ